VVTRRLSHILPTSTLQSEAGVPEKNKSGKSQPSPSLILGPTPTESNSLFAVRKGFISIVAKPKSTHFSQHRDREYTSAAAPMIMTKQKRRFVSIMKFSCHTQKIPRQKIGVDAGVAPTRELDLRNIRF
jgi:hypothetical protein